MIDQRFHLALRPERRRYTCTVCGAQREIVVRRIEKTVLICLHEDSRGEYLPVMQLREEGELLSD